MGMIPEIGFVLTSVTGRSDYMTEMLVGDNGAR